MSQIMDGTKFNSTLNKKITQLKLQSSNYTALIFFHRMVSRVNRKSRK